MSRNACLDAPIIVPLSRDDLGVKKRVKVLGVTVGFFLGLLEPWLLVTGKTGEEGGGSSGTGVVRILVHAVSGSGSSIASGLTITLVISHKKFSYGCCCKCCENSEMSDGKNLSARKVDQNFLIEIAVCGSRARCLSATDVTS